MTYATIADLYFSYLERFSAHPQRVAFKRKLSGAYTDVTVSQLEGNVEDFACGLMDLGLKSGDRIGMISENRLEWVYADLAICTMGAVCVPVFPTLTAKQVEFVFTDCGASAIIVSNSMQLSKVLAVRENIPSLRHIVVLNEDAKQGHTFVKSFMDVCALGRSVGERMSRRSLLQTAAAGIAPDQPATIIYTSGTTGNPKGVVLSHKNLMSNVEGALGSFTITEDDVFLSYLPLCHAYERIGGYFCPLAVGALIAFAESIEKVPENIREIHPTMMTSVPRLFEKIQNRVLSNVQKEKPAKQKIFNWAYSVGRSYVQAKQAGKSPLFLQWQYNIADKLVFSKIRERMGGRIRTFISGGAALSKDTNEFFTLLGISILEGYGLTEASPVVSVNRAGQQEIGTVGKALPNVRIKIADDGEILVAGPSVMIGYWNNPEATSESIDPDGWLHTGDIGIFTASGNLKITDRKKHIFVSRGGKNIAPQPVEALAKASHYIEQCVLFGEGRDFCVAVIVPDFDMIRDYFASQGVKLDSNADIAQSPDVRALIDKELNTLQKDLAKYERIRRYVLLSNPLSLEGGELTPKLSVKRSFVYEKYKAQIEALYDGFE